MRSITTPTLFLLALAALPCRSFAQLYDSSGDNMLNGAYYMREVFYVPQQSEAPLGTVGEAINIQGTITFDGNGNYSFSGSLLDTASGTITPTTGVTTTGTYVISASGMGYITAINPELSSTDQIVGLVAHGIFIGSSTGNGSGYNDLLIAAPIGTTANNSTLKGNYQVAYFDPTYPGDALFSMSPDGNGNVGTINATEYIGTNASSGQTLNGVHYAFSNGAAQFSFGGTANGTQLIAGTELLYISPDGNFIFGGSYNGYDMFVGVRNATSDPANYDGLYYQAGLDLDLNDAANGYAYLDSYYGAINGFFDSVNGHQSIGHQNVNSQLVYDGAADFTYYDLYTLNGDGSSSDQEFTQQYWSSQDGSIRIGFGLGPLLSLNVALQAPTLSGNGVYLSPQGVVNAGSSAPFTAHLSPGEFITLYGTGLAPSNASATVPFPPTLNGVQVMINDRPAPIYYVTPTQISVIVPYFTESIAQIQVINNGNRSNIVTQFVGSTSAGVFTIPEGGVGNAAALHNADFSLVSDASPAQIGETIDVYAAGMGLVSPAVSDGAADPSGTLSTTPFTPTIFIADSTGNFTQVATANIYYSGLAPGFAGLYQISFTIPAGVASGPTSLEIIGPDSDTIESGLPVGSPADNAAAAARAKSLAKRPPIHRHRLMRPDSIGANQVSTIQP